MKKLVSRLPLPYQIFLSVLTISILSITQLAFIEKTSLAFDVTVTVKDKDTDLPIPQAIVKLIKVSTDETTVGVTGDNGEVVFTDVLEGIYDIIADAQCYKRKKKLSNALGEEASFTFKLEQVTDPTGGLSGTV
ncbi:MAG TPA: carboxypeptidase-like regulatory domain-containing protein, partial [Candidatus Brocadiia bacterium]